MSFFVDANVPAYAARRSAPRAACQSVLDAIAAGAEGKTSTAVAEEVWHLELSGKIGVKPGLARRTLELFSPLLAVSEEILRVALEIEAPRLGANDRLHVATCLANGIDTIVTADAAFDSVRELRRVDPLDAEALAALLGTT